MRYLKRFNESNLLNIKDNEDIKLISIIKDEFTIGSNILEISCGNASDSLYLKNLGYNIVCTELDDNYIKNAKDLGINCIKHNTISKFPFSDSQFDLVYSRLGLHYFNENELKLILSELKRISKSILITVKIKQDRFKTGKIILSPENWYNLINIYFNDIKLFNIKEGLLYGEPSKWIEILAS